MSASGKCALAGRRFDCWMLFLLLLCAVAAGCSAGRYGDINNKDMCLDCPMNFTCEQGGSEGAGGVGSGQGPERQGKGESAPWIAAETNAVRKEVWIAAQQYTAGGQRVTWRAAAGKATALQQSVAVVTAAVTPLHPQQK